MEFLASLDGTTILSALFYIFLGTFIGMIIGVLPGLGATVGLIITLPLTYTMTPLDSILLLVAVYQAAEYGGSITSIILGIPGTPAAAATVIDGRPYALKHSPGKALGYSLTASTLGGFVSGLALIFLSVPMASFALQLSEPEFFLIGMLGLLGVASLSSKDKVKSAMSAVLGLMAGTVGMDVFTGAPRFTGGSIHLLDGISVIAVVTAVFAISEILSMINGKLNKTYKIAPEKLKGKITWQEFKKSSKPHGIGSIVGIIIGIIPGLGPGAAAFYSYAITKRFSKNRETFGQGNPLGISAPESANNASVGGSLLPLLALGIPSTATVSVILSTFTIHGVQPGPQVFSTNPELIYGIFVGFMLTAVAMYIVGRLLTPRFAMVLAVPSAILIPIILVLSLIGVYSANSLHFDIWLTLVLGIATFFLVKLDFSVPTFILAFILCPLIEESLRRSLILSDGSYAIFVTRPYSLAILLLIVVILVFSIITTIKERKEKATNTNEVVDPNKKVM